VHAGNELARVTGWGNEQAVFAQFVDRLVRANRIIRVDQWHVVVRETVHDHPKVYHDFPLKLEQRVLKAIPDNAPLQGSSGGDMKIDECVPAVADSTVVSRLQPLQSATDNPGHIAAGGVLSGSLIDGNASVASYSLLKTDPQHAEHKVLASSDLFARPAIGVDSGSEHLPLVSAHDLSDRRQSVDDRASVPYDARDGSQPESRSQGGRNPAQGSHTLAQSLDQSSTRSTCFEATMNCFLSLGFDAWIAYRFHVLRETRPDKTSGVFVNKLWHGIYGAQELCRCRDPINTALELFVDGVAVPIPDTARALQVFSIHSSADGTNYWGTAKSSLSELQHYSPPLLHGTLKLF